VNLGYTALILVCSSQLSIQDCSLDNAIDILNGLQSSTPIDCLMNSQSLIANSGLILDDADGDGIPDQIIKIVCVPSTGVVLLDPR
jgi:hypothetical protein